MAHWDSSQDSMCNSVKWLDLRDITIFAHNSERTWVLLKLALLAHA